MNVSERLNLFHWTESEYDRILNFWRKSSRRERLAIWLVRSLPPLFFVVYSVQLCLMGWVALSSGFAAEQCTALIGAMVFPAGCLFISGLLRRKINRKRPYEQLSIRPLVQKRAENPFHPTIPPVLLFLR